MMHTMDALHTACEIANTACFQPVATPVVVCDVGEVCTNSDSSMRPIVVSSEIG